MQIISVLSQIVAAVANNAQALLAGVIGLLTVVIAICMAIPGDAPEKQLQAVVDFLSKFSKKPNE